jgi:cytochrome c-type biogenesis protein CcmH/NrfF
VTRAIVAVALVALTASPALAAPEDVAADISAEIMSPFCPGVTLHDCPSAEADQLRLEITQWADAGWSRDRIMAHLVSEYGDDIRALPPASGRGLAAWLLPGLALVVGAGIAGMLVRRWSGRTGAASGPAGDPGPMEGSPAQRRRLEAELDALRGEL